ncbi:hypothetical protein PTSG_00303 [Salpingoeca rosetta]|uniref:Uncharacterized protein n=1 Tax=Salpingoeca rosetta (strain ATCC 50818 / BSB-021) TaxID=946362 RepID=F2TW36_SALR5|nr:uncharacterized protein PTSG_00303 [Salpingoeca rosetta]EGD72282.1 hypothetical protein PTSG_00303 [Salpingoeca rosetta]|eukprot:XP_004998852.1 hypothetical protein PTSG_00303 [Salpingoeca rosetta]
MHHHPHPLQHPPPQPPHHQLQPPPPHQLQQHHHPAHHPPPPHHQHHPHHQQHEHATMRHHDEREQAELANKRAKLGDPQTSHVETSQIPMSSQSMPMPLSMHRVGMPSAPMMQGKVRDMMPPRPNCPGIKQKGAKSAPCGDNTCIRCLQINCCKRCPMSGCGQWSPIARRTCRSCNYQFTSRAKEARRKHAGFTEQPKDLHRAAAPASFEQSLQRKISAFFNARDGMYLGVSVYSGRSIVSRLYHNQTSFLAPSVPNDGTRESCPEIASAEEVASRSVELSDPLLANNALVISAIRHLQQDVLRQAERIQDMMKDFMTVTATSGSRARKCAEKIVNAYHPQPEPQVLAQMKAELQQQQQQQQHLSPHQQPQQQQQHHHQHQLQPQQQHHHQQHMPQQQQHHAQHLQHPQQHQHHPPHIQPHTLQ